MIEPPNLRGLKVSDAPFSAVAPYLIDGLDLFIGFDSLIPEGLAIGAVGAVSGVAAITPEFVCDLVRDPSPEKAQTAAERIAFYEPRLIARGKAELAELGIMRPEVRGLRPGIHMLRSHAGTDAVSMPGSAASPRTCSPIP